MSKKIKIAIVEDEMIVAAKIALLLEKLGYEVSGMMARGEEVIAHIEENNPDYIFLDIQLKGALNGLEVGLAIRKKFDIGIIFLTANNDSAHFEQAKAVKPEAFLSKPYRKLDLQRALELAISRRVPVEERNDSLNDKQEIENDFLSDRIFVRHKDKRIKLFNHDILYIESEGNYSRIVTDKREYMMAFTLGVLENKLPADQFIRVHRSFIVNILNIDSVAEKHLVIGQKAVPVSRSNRETLNKRLRLI